MAAQNGHVKVVGALIKAKCEVDKANKDGHTPLFKAVQYGQGEVVEALIKAECDVHKAKTDGATPLLVAFHKGHGDVVEALIKATWPQRHLALIVIIAPAFLRWREQWMEEKRMRRTADNIIALFMASLVWSLFPRGNKRVDKLNKDGRKLLLMAAQNRRAGIVKALIKAKCDVDRADKVDNTLLFRATQNGHVEMGTDGPSSMGKLRCPTNFARRPSSAPRAA